MTVDAARPALKTRSDALNQQLGKFRNLNSKTKTEDLAQEVTIGSVKGRISELSVRLAVARESAMIKCHEKLLGQLTTWVASDMGSEAVLCRPSELMSDLGLIQQRKPRKLSWWERVQYEGCLYEASAYESFQESVTTYMRVIRFLPQRPSRRL